MALYFEKVNLLEYSHAPLSFEAGLVYRVEKRLSITGTIIDRNASSGVSSLVQKEGSIISGATDYDDIYLNGILFGQGKITKISFDGGTMVNRENYSYDIVCYEDGDLFNAASGAYTGIDWTNARLIDNLSESLSFESSQDGRKSYNHAISVRFCEQISATAAIDLAKAFAAQMFSAVSGLGQFLGQYNTIGSAQKVYNESYNYVDGSCSFSENTIIPAEQGAEVYSTELSYQTQLGADGHVRVTETAIIQGINLPRTLSAETGFIAKSGGSYSRCQAIHAAYAFSSPTLINISLTSSVERNKFEGSITFTNEYTTDPKYSELARWEYSIEVSKSENSRIVSESGSVIGNGRAMADKYAKAKSFFDASVAPSAAARAASIYAADGGIGSLKSTQESLSKNEFTGVISYQYSWTDNSINESGDFKTVTTTAEISHPVAAFEKFEIFNQFELMQSQRQNSLGNISLSVKIRGKRTTGLAAYVTRAKTFISLYSSVGNDNFMENCSYSFSPLINEFSLDAQLIFIGASKSPADISINAL